MSFKIVQQTKYVGINNPVAVKELTVVPEKWTKDNLLFWPKNLKRFKLQELKNNPNSKPLENWDIQECVLKRCNIGSLDEANKMLSDMENISDTEREVDALSIPSNNRSKRSKPKKFVNSYQEFEAKENEVTCETTHVLRDQLQYYQNTQITDTNLYQSEVQPEMHVQTEEIVGGISLEMPNNTLEKSPGLNNLSFEGIHDIINQNVSQINGSSFKVLTLDDSLIYLPEKANLNDENFQYLIENQKTIHSMLKKIISGVAGLNAKLDKLIEKQSPQTSSDIPTRIPDNNYKNLKLIETKEECYTMEDKLNNQSYRAVWVTYLTTLFGNKGQFMNKGYDCCFTVIDKIFSRNFLTQCSWSGGSRSELTKISLKAYKNIIDLMFTVVAAADHNFTYEILIKFLKIQLRNSKRRAEVKQNCRQSHSKKRPKINVFGDANESNDHHKTDSVQENTVQ